MVPLASTMPAIARITWTALVCLLALCLGCNKKASGTMAMSEAPYDEYDNAGGYGSGGGDGMYDFEDDSVEGEILSPEGASLSSRGRSSRGAMFDSREEFKSKDEAPPAPPKSSPDPSPEPNASPPEPVVQDPPDNVPTKAAAKRQVIYTANMQVSVYDVEHAMVLVEGLPDRYGGWLHQRSGDQIVLRIPAEHLKAAMDMIAELGVVDMRTLQAFDVTAEYTDLESRIRVLVEMQTQLELLLAKAKDVEQALEIRRALGQITMELELARARMRELSKSIAFSTLIVRIVARGPLVDLPSSNDPFPWVLELGVEATEYR
jgi:chemotaxis protein histidine kinase CheA